MAWMMSLCSSYSILKWMPNQISYKKDWIKDLAEEEGLDIYQAADVVDSIILYIKKLMREPDVATIRLRHVGRLYVALGILKNRRKFYSGRRKSTNKKLEEALDAKIEMLDEHHEKYPYRYSRYKKMVNIKNFFLTKKMSYKELENYQNNGKT